MPGGGGPGGMPGPNASQMPNVDIEQLEDINCDDCGNETFTPGVQMKIIPAVASPDGSVSIQPVQVFACVKCGHAQKIDPQDLESSDQE